MRNNLFSANRTKFLLQEQLNDDSDDDKATKEKASEEDNTEKSLEKEKVWPCNVLMNNTEFVAF